MTVNAIPTGDQARRLVANRVLLTLWVAALLGCVWLPFAAMAPNRLVSGEAINLAAALTTWQAATLALLALLLALAALARPLSAEQGLRLTLAVAPLTLLLTLYALGDYAARALVEASPVARVSQGAAFWVLVFCTLLMIVDAFQRLRAPLWVGGAYGLALAAAIAGLFASGQFNALSILREYFNIQDAFIAQLLTHLRLVALALTPALAIGLPLGLLAHRRPALRGSLFGTLNFFQTIPSIALFALLVAPLSALGDSFPLLRALGIKGIGAAPAIIALIMYSLLPVVRNTHAGFAGVAAATLEAARGMGMTRRQVLWRVEIPLALPVILSGLRIVTVQAIGLTVVAALIGAGGLGAFVFQGLGQYAIDLVLLGAVPTIALAVIADFLLQILVAISRPAGGR
ncbi:MULTISPECIES: ABC transporter permease [Halomonadaceae]|uniref:ABC transporter permease n=1 Tax=Modicisalibacter zincidurans TaxID=1178777 RepID=A0ABP9R5V6_9GAMM|nr:ABC transporter permease [Halomonas zincidurans]MCD6008633.1 ABC transporter permease [Halomonas sp. IOP_31]MEA3251555.1 ABC transporter permease [Pseudomonadota bacterium]